MLFLCVYGSIQPIGEGTDGFSGPLQAAPLKVGGIGKPPVV